MRYNSIVESVKNVKTKSWAIRKMVKNGCSLKQARDFYCLMVSPRQANGVIQKDGSITWWNPSYTKILPPPPPITFRSVCVENRRTYA